jgi:hypothetical protein
MDASWKEQSRSTNAKTGVGMTASLERDLKYNPQTDKQKRQTENYEMCL